jgi:DNA-binding Lrp family transcriptional regulator
MDHSIEVAYDGIRPTESGVPDVEFVGSKNHLTQKSLSLLKFLAKASERRTVYCVQCKQVDLASKLHITRQALGAHFKRLRELGLIQVGRGFINVTSDGLNALGYDVRPVIITAKVAPQKLSELMRRIRAIPAIEIFRVTGGSDLVLIVEHHRLDETLTSLADLDSSVETNSLVSIARIK